MTGHPRPVVAALVVAGALAGAGLGEAATSGGDDGAARAEGVATARPARLPELPAFTRAPGGGELRAERNSAARRGHLTAHLTRAAFLRVSPAGAKVARVALRTGYGAKRVWAAASFKPGWVGVRAVQRPNGKLAWLPEEAVRIEPIRTTVVADLSERRVTVLVDGRVRDRARVAVGRPGHETPIGSYGVTDRLRGGGPRIRAAYGCCIIALTGHQEKLPAGWTNGSRLAIHGTSSPSSVGQEVSAGCLRMRDEDIRRILLLLPLGTTVTVRA